MYNYYIKIMNRVELDEEWFVLKDNNSCIENSNLIYLLSNISKDLKEINNRLTKTENRIDDISSSIIKLNDTINQKYEEEIKSIRTENTDTRNILMENRQVFTNVMDSFMKLEKNEIQPMLKELKQDKSLLNAKSLLIPSYEKTLEQNRIWRLYSNNFRQNITSNCGNILTQLSLSNEQANVD